MGPLSPLAQMGSGMDIEDILRFIRDQQLRSAGEPLPSGEAAPRPTLGSLAGRGLNAIIPGQSQLPGQIGGGIIDALSTLAALQSSEGRFGLGLQESRRRQDTRLAEQKRRSAEAQRGLNLSRAAQTQERLSKVQVRKVKRLSSRVEAIARRKKETALPQSVVREGERLGVDVQGIYAAARQAGRKAEAETTKLERQARNEDLALMDRQGNIVLLTPERINEMFQAGETLPEGTTLARVGDLSDDQRQRMEDQESARQFDVRQEGIERRSRRTQAGVESRFKRSQTQQKELTEAGRAGTQERFEQTQERLTEDQKIRRTNSLRLLQQQFVDKFKMRPEEAAAAAQEALIIMEAGGQFELERGRPGSIFGVELGQGRITGVREKGAEPEALSPDLIQRLDEAVGGAPDEEDEVDTSQGTYVYLNGRWQLKE